MMTTTKLRFPQFPAVPLIISATTLALTNLGGGSALAASLNDSIFNKPNPTRQDLALQSYLWGYPLLATQRTAAEQLNGSTGAVLNQQFNFLTQLATPTETVVVRPNNDTLYANTDLNLSQAPVVLTVPPTGNRYYSFQFLDSYTNDFQYIGTREGQTSGGQYFIYGPNYTGTVPGGFTGTIQAPTDSVSLLGRTLVEGPSDLAAANAVQSQYTLSYYPSNFNPDPYPPIVSGGTPQDIPQSGLGFYSELNADLVNNPPPADPDQSALLASFAAIGVGAGLTPNLTQAEAEAAIATGEALMASELATSFTNVNNWLVNYNLGDYGTDYLLRATTAQFGLGANVAQEALYFEAYKDVSGNSLTGDKKYTLSFEVNEVPPVAPDGFWSITLYNSEGFLVDNPIDRYSIGSNTPGLQYNSDGSLDIYIQHTAPTTAKEFANWLPTPTGGFNLTTRTYLPQQALFDGSYELPGIQLEGSDPSAVPEPLTILGAVTAVGFGVAFKRKQKS
jgi:hypothetical protein